MILKVSKFLTKFLLSQQLYGKALKLLFKQLEEKPNSQTNEKIILNVIIDFIFIEILLINAFNASFYNINKIFINNQILRRVSIRPYKYLKKMKRKRYKKKFRVTALVF